jgi:hypothetical protein
LPALPEGSGQYFLDIGTNGAMVYSSARGILSELTEFDAIKRLENSKSKKRIAVGDARCFFHPNA